MKNWQRSAHAAGDRAADVVGVVALAVPPGRYGGARGCGRGSRARSARSAARWRRCSRPSIRPARDSRRSRCACRPGRGVASNWLCCTTSTNGRSRMLAAPDGGLGGGDLVERAADVHGRGLEAARIAPRDRPVERPVELEDAGAVAIAAQAAHVACRQDRLADVGELRRDWCRTGRRAPAEGRRAAHAHARSRCARRAGADTTASAPAIACEPPAATGQVSTCAVSAKIMPTAAVSGRSSGRIECAAQPASTARARAPRKRARNASVAGSRPGRPKRAISNGCSGMRSGPSRSASNACGSRRNGANEPRVGAGVCVQLARRFGERAAQQHRRLIVERVRDRRAADESSAARARRAAACGRTATARPSDDSRSRRRARSRAASARRCACRRRSRRAPRGRAPTRRRAPARPPRPARSGRSRRRRRPPPLSPRRSPTARAGRARRAAHAPARARRAWRRRCASAASSRAAAATRP